MDFGNAALLAATVFLIVEQLKLLFPAQMKNARVLAGAILLTSQVVPILVAHSDWGPKQVVDGIPLSTMGQGALILVGLSLAGLAGVGYKLTAGIGSIGNSEPQRSSTSMPIEERKAA